MESTRRTKSSVHEWAATIGYAVTSATAIIAVVLGIIQQWQTDKQIAQAVTESRDAAVRYERDRLARVMPFLAFESSFAQLTMEKDDRPFYRFDFVRDSEGKVLELSKFPVLRNYGAGPAFAVKVKFLADSTTELPENAYFGAVAPGNIFPQSESRCIAFPPALNDPAAPLSSVRGKAVITCRDITGSEREFIHRYRASVGTTKEGSTVFTLLIDDVTLPNYLTDSLYQ